MKTLQESKPGWCCKRVVVLCGWLLIATPSWAATYYVDATLGDDNNNGLSEAAAWKTITKINTTLFAPGNNIYFKRGEVWRGTMLKISSSGQDGAPITLGAYGDTPALPKITPASLANPQQWQPEVNGEYSLAGTFSGRIVFIEDGRRLTGNNILVTLPGTTPGSLAPGQWAWDGAGKIYYKPTDGAPSDHVVELLDNWKVSLDTNNQSHLVIQDLEFYGGLQQTAYIWGTNIALRNCKVHSGYRGLEVHLSKNILIENNEVYDINWKGISITNGTSAAVVRGNHVHDIGRLDEDDGDLSGIAVGGGNGLLRPWDAVVEGNLVEYIGRDWYDGKEGTDSTGIMGSTGINLNAARQAVVRNNTIRWCWRTGIIITAASEITDDIKVYGNVIHDIGKMSSLNWISDGISVYATEGHPISRVSIFNNTIANSTFKSDLGKKQGAFRILVYDRPEQGKIGSQVSDITFVNNIAANVSGDYAISVESEKSDGIVNLISDFNIVEKEASSAVYWKPTGGTAIIYPDFASYVSATGQDSHSYADDPAFANSLVSDFHLMEGSIAINAGTPTERSADHDGIPIADVPDIGAYEFQYADLVIALSDTPDPALLGDTVTYTINVTNDGPSPASGVTVTGTLPSCDLGNIASGTSATCTHTVTASQAGTLAQTMQVAALEYDPNGSNNTATAGTTVTAPDLVPTAMTATKLGNRVYVSDTVKNQGNGNAGSFTVGYFLSVNTSYEPGADLPLVTTSGGSTACTRTVASLTPGTISNVSSRLCYKPGSAVTGQRYYVLVVDDATTQVLESSEANNVRATTGTIKW